MINIRVSVKDYQIIKQAILDFKPGLTSIIGPSNNGKSSILKAIKSAVYTEPGSTPIRTGAQSYIVGIQDNGHTVVYQKKDGSSKYLVDDKSYSKFGLSTPEEVSTALNIRELILNGNKVQLNFWNQMDKPFLLDKSAGELFKFILDSGENDQLSSVLKAMVTDRQSLNKEADNLQGQITALEDSIDKQQKESDKLVPVIEKANNLIDKKSKYDELNKLKELIQNYFILDKRIEEHETDLKIIKDKEKIYSKLNLKLFKNKLDINKDIEDYNQNETQILNVYNDIVNTQNMLDILNRLKLSELSYLINKIDEYKIILNDIEKYSDVILKLTKAIPSKTLIDKIPLVENRNKIFDIIEKLYSFSEREFEILNELENLESSYNKIKEIEKLFKVCPLCGQALEGGKLCI